MSSRTKRNIPVTEFPDIPLDAYRMCLTRTARSLTVLQMSVSLSFGKHFVTIPHPPFPPIGLVNCSPDVVVFVLVIVQTHIIRGRYQGMGRPDLLDRFSRDTELYFGVISTSHFVIVVIFAAARVGFFVPIPQWTLC